MLFWKSITVLITAFYKRTIAAISDLHDPDLEQLREKKRNHIFICFLHFICFDIQDLALGILKMLIPL